MSYWCQFVIYFFKKIYKTTFFNTNSCLFPSAPSVLEKQVLDDILLYRFIVLRYVTFSSKIFFPLAGCVRGIVLHGQNISIFKTTWQSVFYFIVSTWQLL
jgi:hypothetical protein